MSLHVHSLHIPSHLKVFDLYEATNRETNPVPARMWVAIGRTMIKKSNQIDQNKMYIKHEI